MTTGTLMPEWFPGKGSCTQPTGYCVRKCHKSASFAALSCAELLLKGWEDPLVCGQDCDYWTSSWSMLLPQASWNMLKRQKNRWNRFSGDVESSQFLGAWSWRSLKQKCWKINSFRFQRVPTMGWIGQEFKVAQSKAEGKNNVRSTSNLIQDHTVIVL